MNKLVDGVLTPMSPNEQAEFESSRGVGPTGGLPKAPRQVEMWKARAVMATTPWNDAYGGSGKTILQAVQAAIQDLSPTQRVLAETALEYGNYLTRDGSMAGVLRHALGVSDEQYNDLILQADAIPT